MRSPRHRNPSGLELVPYRASWPEDFALEADVVRREFGELATRVEHVGSTAVAGLSAKPVIDLRISVRCLRPLAPFLAPLGRLGYTQVSLGEFDRVYPFFVEPAAWPSTHHGPLCEAGGEQEATHIAFRDYLRDHRPVAQQYLELKVRLAAASDGLTRASRAEYSLGKAEFIEAVLANARAAGYYAR